MRNGSPRRPTRPPELDGVASQWQVALDAADRALSAAGASLEAAEVGRQRRVLEQERRQTAASLVRLARTLGISPAPWLSTVPLTSGMLGLPATTEACIFDLDGVLTNSASLHAGAWATVFDDFLMRLGEKTGWHVVPFDPEADYDAYVDGRPRLEGIHAFLNGRGIHIPEGRPDDPADADTAYGLAAHKRELTARRLRERGVTPLPGARRYLEAVDHAGLASAVVSSSASTRRMLELAGLAALVDERVDAEVVGLERLRTRPAPDVLLFLARRLGARPEGAVTFTHSPAGVAAGLSAGLTVVGVGAGGDAEVLEGFGAPRVVASLDELLDRRLADLD